MTPALKEYDAKVQNLKVGRVSNPVDLSSF